jgi:hypothetical protein
VVALFHIAWNLTILVGAGSAGELPAIMSVGLMVLAAAIVVRYGAKTLAPEGLVQLSPPVRRRLS